MKYLFVASGRGERSQPADPGVESRHSLFASGAGITVVIVFLHLQHRAERSLSSARSISHRAARVFKYIE